MFTYNLALNIYLIKMAFVAMILFYQKKYTAYNLLKNFSVKIYKQASNYTTKIYGSFLTALIL